MSRKQYNDVYFDFDLWYWHIEDDIMAAWCKKLGEDLVLSTLNSLREWLKQKPEFQKTIDKGYGGNWCIWIWDCLERNEMWRRENG